MVLIIEKDCLGQLYASFYIRLICYSLIGHCLQMKTAADRLKVDDHLTQQQHFHKWYKQKWAFFPKKWQQVANAISAQSLQKNPTQILNKLSECIFKYSEKTCANSCFCKLNARKMQVPTPSLIYWKFVVELMQKNLRVCVNAVAPHNFQQFLASTTNLIKSTTTKRTVATCWLVVGAITVNWRAIR